jgi:hypothetical protein
MAGRIQNLEIFAAGTWKPGNGGGKSVTVTERDLDDMVQSFQALQGTNIVKPHLKLGHEDAQKWFGQRSGVPSLGWVERVWRQGAKLFADVKDVPDILIDMIKRGRYHNVSIEVFPQGSIEHEGKKFGQVLSAVALLGTEMPAVKNLAGLASALFSQEMQPAAFGDGIVPLTFSSIEPEQSMFTQEQVDSLVAAAVSKNTTDVTAKFSSQIEDLTSQVTVLTQRAEGAEAKFAEAQDAAAFSEAERIVDDAIKAGKLLPKQKDMAMAFATQKTTLKFGGADKSPSVLFKEFLDSAGTQVELGDKTKKDKEAQTYATAAHELDARVQEKITQAGGAAKLSYADAMTSVLAADVDLKARYSAAQS